MLAASLLALIDVIAIIFWMTRLVCRKLPQKKLRACWEMT